KKTILASFADWTDGSYPFAALTLDAKTGAIYGTTCWGGAYTDGCVFKLTPTGSGYEKSILYSFNHEGHHGVEPEGQMLLRPNGALYGTVFIGGRGCSGVGCGSVYELKPSGSGYSFKYIYNFAQPVNGADPAFSGLIADRKGALYGSTRSGGTKTNCY